MAVEAVEAITEAEPDALSVENGSKTSLEDQIDFSLPLSLLQKLRLEFRTVCLVSPFPPIQILLRPSLIWQQQNN